MASPNDSGPDTPNVQAVRDSLAAQKQALAHLLHILRDQNPPSHEERQLIVSVLRAYPNLMAAFVRHRELWLHHQHMLSIGREVQQLPLDLRLLEQPPPNQLHLQMPSPQVDAPQMQNEVNERDQLPAAANELESYVSAMKALIEQEFTCSICTELFCDAVTLNCRHTFCSHCLREWKNRRDVCPECRTYIMGETQPILMDRFLDQVSQLLGYEFMHRREEIRNERAALAAFMEGL